MRLASLLSTIVVAFLLGMGSCIAEPTAEKLVEDSLIDQLIKLERYVKRSQNIEVVDSLGGQNNFKNMVQCKRFLDQLSSDKKERIPRPVRMVVGADAAQEIGEQAYKIALSNKDKNEKSVGIDSELYRQFMLKRERAYYYFFVEAYQKIISKFDREKFMDSLFSPLINPLLTLDADEARRLGVASKIVSAPIVALYENKINFPPYKEVIVATFLVRNQRAAIFVNGIDARGFLSVFWDSFSLNYYGITDVMGSFDETVFDDLIKAGSEPSEREPPSPSILNGLVSQDGIVLRWSLKSTGGEGIKIPEGFSIGLSVEDIVSRQQCFILIK